MGENVVIIFLKGNKIVVEQRLTESGKFDLMLLPGGGIEEFDRTEAEDYRVTAMKREIKEELGEHITVKGYTFLTTAESSEQLRMFHCYIVHDWDGEIPEYGLEDGKTNAKLEWMDIEDAFLVVHNDIARTIVGRALAGLRDGSIQIPEAN